MLKDVEITLKHSNTGQTRHIWVHDRSYLNHNRSWTKNNGHLKSMIDHALGMIDPACNKTYSSHWNPEINLEMFESRLGPNTKLVEGNETEL